MGSVMQSILNFFADNLVYWSIIFACSVGLAITKSYAESKKPPQERDSRDSMWSFVRVSIVMIISFFALYVAVLVRLIRWIW